MKRPAESSKEFLDVLSNWQTLEDSTISSARELMDRTDNPIIRMAMEMAIHDSEKHKAMQQMIIDNVTKEAAHLSPDELAQLAGLLNKHMEMEARSIALANEALEKSELFMPRYILSYLIADEEKHHDMMNKLLADLKAASVPTSVSSRF